MDYFIGLYRIPSRPHIIAYTVVCNSMNFPQSLQVKNDWYEFSSCFIFPTSKSVNQFLASLTEDDMTTLGVEINK